MSPPRPRIPPLVVFLAFGAAMWLLDRNLPALAFELTGRRIIATCLALAGITVAVLGVRRFVRAKTTVNPMKPEEATSLVTQGIYTRTRNPMYLGLFFALLGWAVLLANPVPFLVLPLFVAFMNRFQIAPEEAAMVERFGREYEEYRRRVRRWL